MSRMTGTDRAQRLNEPYRFTEEIPPDIEDCLLKIMQYRTRLSTLIEWYRGLCGRYDPDLLESDRRQTGHYVASTSSSHPSSNPYQSGGYGGYSGSSASNPPGYASFQGGHPVGGGYGSGSLPPRSMSVAPESSSMGGYHQSYGYGRDDYPSGQSSQYYPGESSSSVMSPPVSQLLVTSPPSARTSAAAEVTVRHIAEPRPEHEHPSQTSLPTQAQVQPYREAQTLTDSAARRRRSASKRQTRRALKEGGTRSRDGYNLRRRPPRSPPAA